MTCTASSRHYVVTGAATGIGLAVARRLVGDGNRVTGVGLDEQAGLAEQEALRRTGCRF